MIDNWRSHADCKRFMLSQIDIEFQHNLFALDYFYPALLKMNQLDLDSVKEDFIPFSPPQADLLINNQNYFAPLFSCLILGLPALMIGSHTLPQAISFLLWLVCFPKAFRELPLIGTLLTAFGKPKSLSALKSAKLNPRKNTVSLISLLKTPELFTTWWRKLFRDKFSKTSPKEFSKPFL